MLNSFLSIVFVRPLKWLYAVGMSALILGVLFFIIVNFYIYSSIVNLDSFFYAFLMLSLLTDGLFTLIHLPRRTQRHQKRSFAPAKLTIVIASYNGEDVIAETIKQAHKHVPLSQVIVVSDASTDRTAEVARATGAKVIENKRNLHKVGSINAALKAVKTPYVLILDDDTLIGKTFIPTSMLDDGYTAVAFNVMPVKTRGILNALQRFEYRSTMQLGKNLRASVGAIGNVSGAIGLYRTKDLTRQITLHSGQFAGEDEQRTLLAHMYGEGKGITYTDSLVLTHAPATYKDLFKQRSFSWSLSVPELFVLYMRVLLSLRFHYILKSEKAYQVYIYLTDPLRILFLWTLILKPSHMIYTYGFYVILNFFIWLRLGAKDDFRVVLLTPLYTLCLTICRFIGYFYWFKVKTKYLITQLHKPIVGRRLTLEYSFVFAIVILSWGLSIQHFRSDMHLFNKINNERLTSNATSFNYDANDVSTLTPASMASENEIIVPVETGDTTRSVAHKLIDQYTSVTAVYFSSDDQRRAADTIIANQISPDVLSSNVGSYRVSKDIVQNAILQSGAQEL